MLKIVLLPLLISTAVFALNTKTNTTFGTAVFDGTDKYGNSIYNQTVTIQTKNFKVDNFWNKFSFSGEGQDNISFDSISKTGTFRVTVETTSACTLDSNLTVEGCSGQKPFLLNNEIFDTPMDGTTDIYEVAFTEAGDFSAVDTNNFYPLDVLRNPDYYAETNTSTTTTTSRGFLGFFTSSFDYIFSKTIGFGNDYFGDPDIADVEYTNRSDVAEDRRQRYMANIMAGVERDKRMTKSVDGSTATQINAPILNTPVSLLHYAEAKKVTESEQCKFMFLNLSNDGMMCRLMGGFGMDAWMPFFNQTQTSKIETNMILTDTENSLLAMTGTIESIPYMQDVGGTDDDKLSFLQNMLKPMTTMFTRMKTIMFGSDKASLVSDPVERVYEFDEDKAMTLTFAITDDGTQVDDFANFKLLKIRSVYGDKVTSCTVKKVFSMGPISKTLWEETFYEDITTSKDGKTNTEWVDWCQEAIGTKGIFDYLTDWSTGGIFNPINWFLSFLSLFGPSYEITDFTNAIGRGLILDIKKVNTDPMSIRNSQTFKIMHVENN